LKGRDRVKTESLKEQVYEESEKAEIGLQRPDSSTTSLDVPMDGEIVL